MAECLQTDLTWLGSVSLRRQSRYCTLPVRHRSSNPKLSEKVQNLTGLHSAHFCILHVHVNFIPEFQEYKIKDISVYFHVRIRLPKKVVCLAAIFWVRCSVAALLSTSAAPVRYEANSQWSPCSSTYRQRQEFLISTFVIQCSILRQTTQTQTCLSLVPICSARLASSLWYARSLCFAYLLHFLQQTYQH